MNRREKEARKKRKRKGISRPSRDATLRHDATSHHSWTCKEIFLEQGGLIYAAECQTCHRGEAVTVEYEELDAVAKGLPMPDVGREDDERWERRGDVHALNVTFEDHQGFVATLDKDYAVRALADAAAKGWGPEPPEPAPESASP